MSEDVDLRSATSTLAESAMLVGSVSGSIWFNQFPRFWWRNIFLSLTHSTS